MSPEKTVFDDVSGELTVYARKTVTVKDIDPVPVNERVTLTGSGFPIMMIPSRSQLAVSAGASAWLAQATVNRTL
jgi:hypothetical protein